MKSISIKDSNITAVKGNVIDLNVCLPMCISLMVLLPTVLMISKQKARKFTNILICIVSQRFLAFD